ncbi:hypothetical protein BTO05_06660 [Winogradskyella sp. PC-19]|uniref:T9SS type A sorting domain-containing protein n=1 Tax=unclassified Winogradskyella TaxID=2615021 RepID=UPI000B3D2707|nr:MULTISPECIES: T9SS type A sorting domain-containing protein [unclassified Winogradskyella]ARV09332.1 hypothetical protein BTO05_06660 [Winogradskyella sp. PC-19]RZN83146.1 MAG: T9SS type A sorting domain-containing protein [Winogradskyella sp.]
MKKITLTLALILSSGLMFGQVVFTEDFEAPGAPGTPSGWSITDDLENTPPEIWTIENTGEAGGFTTGNTAVYDNGGDGSYATFNSDGYGNTGTLEQSTLTSPVFNASSLTTAVTLSFATFYNGSFGGQGVVQVSNNSGITWTTIQTYSTAADGSAPTVSGIQSLDAPQLIGAATAQIRFVWTGNWSLSWSIDNISIFQCTETLAPSCVTEIGPTNNNNNVTLGPDNSITFEWNTDPLATTYELFINGFSQGNRTSGITFVGFDFNTAYSWSVVPSNCFGIATSCPTWNFTTESCTETAAPACPVTISPTQNQTNVATTEATDGSRQVELSWNTSATAVDYTVIFDGNELGNLADTSVNITGLSLDTTYTYSILANNCFGQSTTCTTVTFTTETTLGTQEDDILNVNLSPNPAKDILNINTSSQIDNVEIFDLLGKKVNSYSKESIYDNSINIASLPTGVYLVLISSENLTKTVRIVKE